MKCWPLGLHTLGPELMRMKSHRDNIYCGLNKGFDDNTELAFEYHINDDCVAVKSSNRDWSAYNKAEMNEIADFDILLKELVDTLYEPKHVWGRKPIPWRDILMIVILKAYSGLPGRRFQHEIQRLYNRGLISTNPHWSIISDRLRYSSITPYLDEIFKQTYLPFAGIETEFAVDASGFRTTSKGMYMHYRHGESKYKKWLKAHIAIGLETKIITAAKITEGNVSDKTQMSGLLQDIIKHFNLEYVYADKGYMSRDVIDEIYDLGAKPFIPFKSNAVTRARGARHWKKAFYYFHLQQDEFYSKYHKRSNVEATFGAIKKKLGESIKSRKFDAQRNELLCKLIAYNISIVIKEMYRNM